MKPGPTYVYECPNCGNRLKNGSMRSGNTFGAKIYSDGRCIAPMFAEYPDLTKCRKCDTIFYLSKLKAVETIPFSVTRILDSSNFLKPDFDHAVPAEFLEIEDYFRALRENIADNVREERNIRKHIWWAYNDRTRHGKNQFTDENDEIRWKENCHHLLTLLDPSDLNQKITTAEIHRNLGNFETCIEIIQSIEKGDLNELKEKLTTECNHKNPWVVRLN